MRGLGAMAELMAMVDTFLLINLKLQLFGLITKQMVREHLYTRVGMYLQVAGRITKLVVMVCISMQTEPNMTDNGGKIYLTVMVVKHIWTKVNTWETFLEGKSMVKGL